MGAQCPLTPDGIRGKHAVELSTKLSGSVCIRPTVLRRGRYDWFLRSSWSGPDTGNPISRHLLMRVQNCTAFLITCSVPGLLFIRVGVRTASVNWRRDTESHRRSLAGLEVPFKATEGQPKRKITYAVLAVHRSALRKGQLTRFPQDSITTILQCFIAEDYSAGRSVTRIARYR